MKRSDIPKDALVAQVAAAHPQTSVWVSANAGSGKTHVLTERVIRLLLSGTEPARILCLTYTKAAAAVMQTRIFRTLSEWTEFSDKELSEELFFLEGKQPDAKRLAVGRRLFARALETPGGLKIQTIHAFCEALLHQFPLEANIAGHFEMMDDIHRRELLKSARRNLLEKAYLNKTTLLHDAFMLVLKTVGEHGLDQLLNEAVEKRKNLNIFLPIVLGDNGEFLLRQKLGLSQEDSARDLIAKIKNAALIAPDILLQCQTYGHTKTAEFVARIALLSEADNDEAIIESVMSAYFTSDKPRSVTHMTSKSLREKLPFIEADIVARQTVLQDLLEKLRRVRLVPLNMAAFRLCAGLLEHYEKLKKADGLLDFDDLIDRALNLLKRDGAGQWVQYKLDRGIDHILVDEAQDTSPAQWEIVQLLSQEFFVGESQRDAERTVFAVGDEKQSIYSFQGAIPEDFAANGKKVKARVEQVNKKFENLRLNFSFRSTPEVLNAVDLVFESPENYKGLSADNEKTVHRAIRKQDIGEVELWDMIAPVPQDEPEDWRLPVDQLHAPAVRLAEEIAKTIADWLKNGEMLIGKGRLLKASDIIVLVRKRDQFVPALARALKNREVPVAGADRLHLTQHIGVRDLMALARFCLQPKDDLSLASVLKSPLFGLSEEDLFALAAYRKKSLWQSLREMSAVNAHYQLAFENLKKYRSMADKMPVFEFYSHILSEDGGRRKILARLGSEASDVLDAFMDYALALQKSGLPGLQAFLETLTMAAPEIKRELDQNREEVRIMTVHAAKGLEGAVVFLVDSSSRIWNTQHEPKLITLPDLGGDGASHTTPNAGANFLLWQPTADLKTSLGQNVIEGLKTRAEEEYRRLLYVGMTRAEDRLIVCGYRKKVKVQGTWAELVGAAIKPHAVEITKSMGVTIDGVDDSIAAWRYVMDEKRTPKMASDAPSMAPTILHPIPTFLSHKMPAEPDLPKPLTPSGASLAIDDEAVGDVKTVLVSPVLGAKTENASFAIERGTLIHRLLQYLPDCEASDRENLATRYLEKVAAHWSEVERTQAKEQALGLIESETLQGLFAKTSRAEVSLMGIVEINGKKRAISGQIDRLSVLGDRIIVADFKTGRPPAHEGAIAQSYLMQMALYRRLLSTIHPNKSIETLLIYSDGPNIFKLNSEILDKMVYA